MDPERKPDEQIDEDDIEEIDTHGTELKLEGKASFREQSTFLRVLEESSKYRNKIPEPKGNNSPRKLEVMPQRPFPDSNPSPDHSNSPRNIPSHMRPLSRARNSSPLSASSDGVLPGTGGAPSPTVMPRQYAGNNDLIRGRQRVMLPPVNIGDMGLKKETTHPKLDNVMLYSRQGNEIIARLNSAGPNKVGSGAPEGNTPKFTRGTLVGTPRSKDYSGRIGVDDLSGLSVNGVKKN